MTDRYDEIAEKLLPCDAGCEEDHPRGGFGMEVSEHYSGCCARRRPAVAAELRRMGETVSSMSKALAEATNVKSDLRLAQQSFYALVKDFDLQKEELDAAYLAIISLETTPWKIWTEQHSAVIAKARKHVEGNQ